MVEYAFQVSYQQGKHYKIKINSNIEIEFRRKGTKYVCPNKVLLAMAGGQKISKIEAVTPTEVEVNHADVQETDPMGDERKRRHHLTQSPRVYSKRVIDTLKMQRNLGYPALSSMKKYVSKGYILNLPITPRHIEEAIIATNGKTTEEMKGKAQPNHRPLPNTIKEQVES